MSLNIPRLLIIDDVFGRTLRDGINQERRALCGQYLLSDVTGDERPGGQTIRRPVAQAVFFRGQQPRRATVGDTVENDPEGVMQIAAEGWTSEYRAEPCWSLVLLDLCFYTGLVTIDSDLTSRGMPEGRRDDDDPEHYFGLTILEALHRKFPDLPVIILSSKPRESASRQFASMGALGFIDRSSANGPAVLREYLWRHGLIQDDSERIVGRSRELLLALRNARRSAMGRRNVLLRGERGSGKELFAAYIHRQTPAEKQARPWVVVDSGTLDAQLFASSLFGHRRGAFTGAERDREGLVARAHGGDLFLDEIGNMPAEVQAGLLRVLEERSVIPIGANEPTAVDVRFLSATNEDIEGKANAGAFRADLLDRLRQGGTLWLPPLRNRAGDFPVLVKAFVSEAESSIPGAMERQIDPAALEKLMAYDWPGNVRELRDCIFKAVAEHPDVEYLVPGHIQLGPRPEIRKPAAIPAAAAALSLDEVVEILENFDFAALSPLQMSARLPILQRHCARFLARYLAAALCATRRPTPANPAGEIMIHPAIKLITGDPGISGSRASDVIKRLLRTDLKGVEDLVANSPLRDAYRTALRLRPAGRQKP